MALTCFGQGLFIYGVFFFVDTKHILNSKSVCLVQRIKYPQ